MGLNDVLEFYKSNVKPTLFGEGLPYYTIKEICKTIKKDSSYTRKLVKKLVKQGVLIEHPFNYMLEQQKFRLNREQIGKI